MTTKEKLEQITKELNAQGRGPKMIQTTKGWVLQIGGTEKYFIKQDGHNRFLLYAIITPAKGNTRADVKLLAKERSGEEPSFYFATLNSAELYALNLDTPADETKQDGICYLCASKDNQCHLGCIFNVGGNCLYGLIEAERGDTMACNPKDCRCRVNLKPVEKTMTIKVEDRTIAGTPAEIMAELKGLHFSAEEITPEQYKEHLMKTAGAIYDAILPIHAPGTENERDHTIIKAMAGIGWLKIEDDVK